jgi:hypothetical protein
LTIAHTAKHRALSDARLVKATCLAMRKDIPTVKTIDAVTRGSPPRTFTDALVCALEPPPGFAALSTASAERWAIAIVDEHGWQRPQPRMIPPRMRLEVHGVAYVIAHCHRDGCENTFR